MNSTSLKYNVYYIIDESDIFYDVENLRFYFSSELLKTKFIEKLKNLEIDKKIFEQRYGVNLKSDNIILLMYYQKTEKRGFKVIDVNTHQNVNKFVIIVEI